MDREHPLNKIEHTGEVVVGSTDLAAGIGHWLQAGLLSGDPLAIAAGFVVMVVGGLFMGLPF